MPLKLPGYGKVEWSGTRVVGPILSVVIPAYNEDARIVPCLEEIAKYQSTRGEPYEVLVVDDGRRDRTADTVRDFMREHSCFSLLHYERNRGKGHAVRVGMLAAHGRMRLMTDADGSTPIEDIELLRARMPTKRPAVVVGSRELRAAGVERRIRTHRYLIGQGFRFLRQLLLRVGVQDTQCGFKLFDALAAETLFAAARIDGFAFDVEILFLATRAEIPIIEVPVNWHDSDSSRVNLLTDPVKMIRDIWRIRRLHRHTVVPIAQAA